MTKTSYLAILFTFTLFSSLTLKNLIAETIDEKWPNGKSAKVYQLDSEKKKYGEYKEYYENGKVKVKCFYKKDLLDGLYQEFLEDGKKSIDAQYTKGLKNGVYRTYQKGLITSDELWIGGVLAFPKSQAEIKRILTIIPTLKTEFVGEWPADFKTERFSKDIEADNVAGMTKLREFRYLCDLPYEDLTINKKYVSHNLDAVIILNKINRLDHTPANPGLPEDTYKSGYTGTSSSNLANGGRGMSGTKSVEMYMNDSDKSNIDRVGHRRWCLNPAMQMTGFGSEGSFSAMWSFDSTRKEIKDYDFVNFPAKGYMPSTHFRSSYAWSVSLNPKLYSKPEKETVNVKISSVKGTLKEELKISYQNIEHTGFGINNCIIFKPDNVSVSPKSRYHVEILGIKDKSGKDTKIEYYVEFF